MSINTEKDNLYSILLNEFSYFKETLGERVALILLIEKIMIQGAIVGEVKAQGEIQSKVASKVHTILSDFKSLLNENVRSADEWEVESLLIHSFIDNKLDELNKKAEIEVKK